MESENQTNRPFANIEKCVNALNHAIRIFQEFVSDKTSSDPAVFYQAQKYFEESKSFYQEASKEISELFGFSPTDASPGFKKWKENFLKGTGIISESKEFETLKRELQNDGFLHRFLTPEEIDELLRKHFESQQSGKRKLENIKARIILDKTLNLMAEAETLEMKAKEKLYQLR